MKQQYLSSRFAPMSDCNQPRYLRQLHSDDVLSISCNECLPCLLKKSRNDTLDVTISTQTFKYVFFVNLDYATPFIPIMRHEYIPEEKIIYCESVVRPSVKIPTNKRRKDGSIVFTTFSFRAADETRPFCFTAPCESEEEYRLFVRKVNLTANGKYPMYKDYFPYLSHYDVALFMKRLRNLFLKKYGQSIYMHSYIVGEYGPVHFRPHYHIIISSNDPRFAESLEHFVDKAWFFGGASAEIPDGNCASYVASYVNSSVSLPVLFRKHRLVRPFSRKCRGFLMERFAPDSLPFGERTDRDINGTLCSIGDASFQLYPRRSYRDRVYPRLFKVGRFDLDQLLTVSRIITRIFRTICKQGRQRTAAELARSILRYVQFGRDPNTEVLRQFIYFNETDIPLARSRATRQMLFSRSYRIAYSYCSLVRFWTSCDICGFGFDREIELAIRNVNRYYSETEYRYLVNQYEDILRFIDSEFYRGEVDDLLMYYDRSPERFIVSKKHRKVSMSDTFPASTIKTNRLFQAVDEECHCRIQNSIKHKELNDLNYCFLNI